MKLNTHLSINKSLCGSVTSISENAAVVRIQTTDDMAVDKRRLVHGGFIFGAADYAAMAAVNDPNVVLGSAEVKFLKPSQAGDSVILTANVVEATGKRRRVEVEGKDGNNAIVFSGTFTCFVLPKHVLD
jgi:acyl-coenzyme A thioesterase PaaI-like protein